jgi:hypothetical protein
MVIFQQASQNVTGTQPDFCNILETIRRQLPLPREWTSHRPVSDSRKIIRQIQPHHISKTLGAFLLLLWGEGRDEGGRAAAAAPWDRPKRPCYPVSTVCRELFRFPKLDISSKGDIPLELCFIQV